MGLEVGQRTGEEQNTSVQLLQLGVVHQGRDERKGIRDVMKGEGYLTSLRRVHQACVVHAGGQDSGGHCQEGQADLVQSRAGQLSLRVSWPRAWVILSACACGHQEKPADLEALGGWQMAAQAAVILYAVM